MNKVLAIVIVLSLSGCVTLATSTTQNINKVVTPENVLKYATFDDLVKNSPNLKSYTPYLYDSPEKSPSRQWVNQEYLIPFKTLEMYCTEKNKGVIKRTWIDGSLNDPLVYRRETGSYACMVNDRAIWLIHLRTGTDNGGSTYFKTVSYNIWHEDPAHLNRQFAEEKAFQAAYMKNMPSIQETRAQIKRDSELRKQKEIDLRVAGENKFRKEVSQRKVVSTKDVGKTICREATIYGINIPNIEKRLHNGSNVVMGVLDQAPANTANIRVSLLGLMTKVDRPLAMPAANFNYIPLEAGRVIWESKYDWFVCQ